MKKSMFRQLFDQWDSPAEILPVLGLILVGLLAYKSKLNGTQIITGIGICLGCHSANYATYKPPKI